VIMFVCGYMKKWKFHFMPTGRFLKGNTMFALFSFLIVALCVFVLVITWYSDNIVSVLRSCVDRFVRLFVVKGSALSGKEMHVALIKENKARQLTIDMMRAHNRHMSFVEWCEDTVEYEATMGWQDAQQAYYWLDACGNSLVSEGAHRIASREAQRQKEMGQW